MWNEQSWNYLTKLKVGVIGSYSAFAIVSKITEISYNFFIQTIQAGHVNKEHDHNVGIMYPDFYSYKLIEL